MIDKFETFITPFQLPRTVHMYLPENWWEGDRRWPVIYMYDGHNLFFDEEATYGKCWGLRDFLDYIGQPCIVVGVECNHHGNDRLSEYSPYDFEAEIRVQGRGKEYMRWLVDELKPFVDAHFPTLPDRRHTGIMGSSMGGLMSAYSIFVHNDVFSRAGCLSSSVGLCPDAILQDAYANPVDPDTKAYFSWGSKEIRGAQRLAQATALNLQLANRLTEQHAQAFAYLHPGGTHSEASWEDELPQIWHWLFSDWEREER